MVTGMTKNLVVDSIVDVCTSGDLLKGELINNGETTPIVLRNACFCNRFSNL